VFANLATLNMVDHAKITVGDHVVQGKFLGLTWDVDIIWATCVAAAIVLTLGFILQRNITPGVPGKMQLFWEVMVEQVEDLIDSAIGEKGRKFVPLGVGIFIFIWTCNWMEIIPSGHNPDWLPTPTADVNLPLAMAVVVIFLVHYNSVKERGWKGYFHHYTQPYLMLTPINIIEEITKPITLTFRLFGNLFSSILMVVVIAALLPLAIVVPAELVWKLFALFIGLIQAYIFALLTIIYLGMGMAKADH
jgi:F-type H+-transporting ATPase subunit a